MMEVALVGSSTSANGTSCNIGGGQATSVPLSPYGDYRFAVINSVVTLRFVHDGSAVATAADIILPANSIEVWSAGGASSVTIYAPQPALVSITPVRPLQS